jgi:hypothetical protein
MLHGRYRQTATLVDPPPRAEGPPESTEPKSPRSRKLMRGDAGTTVALDAAELELAALT